MFLNDTAAIITAVGDPDVSTRWHEKDIMIALEHMVLAATALSYGACWIGAFDEDAVKHLLKIPARMKVVALLPMVYETRNLVPNRENHHQSFSSKKSGKLFRMNVGGTLVFQCDS